MHNMFGVQLVFIPLFTTIFHQGFETAYKKNLIRLWKSINDSEGSGPALDSSEFHGKNGTHVLTARSSQAPQSGFKIDLRLPGSQSEKETGSVMAPSKSTGKAFFFSKQGIKMNIDTVAPQIMAKKQKQTNWESH